MTTFARTIGGPGSGKTRRALEILARCIDQDGLDPFTVGFVSFTKAARREASTRAAALFGCKPADLEKEGFFRTLHSICYRQIGVEKGELITGTAEDNEWLRGILDDERACLTGRSDDDDYLQPPDMSSTAAQALSMWDHARNRLKPVAQVHASLRQTSIRLPDLQLVQEIIVHYEDAKATAGRLDFCDLLLRFAGLRWSGIHAEPLERCRPDGLVPVIPVYLHDEAQDMSALTARVFERLVQGTKWAYLLGDDWQEVYGWAGSDGRLFSSWPVSREEMLPLSHRCRSKILERAQAMMNCQVENPRDFKAAHEGGEVIASTWQEALNSVKAGEDTLVLARTNDLSRDAASYLDGALLPWKPIKGGGGFAAPARAAGVKAFLDLRAGRLIDGNAMYRMFDLLPSRKDGADILVRGTKKRMEDQEGRQQMASTLANLDLFGATEALKTAIASGSYLDLLEPAAARMARSGEIHGVEAISAPACRVGTAHASKGLEADHVVVINSIPYPTRKAIQTEEGLAEERRLWYVASTRARHKMTIAETGVPFPEM